MEDEMRSTGVATRGKGGDVASPPPVLAVLELPDGWEGVAGWGGTEITGITVPTGSLGAAGPASRLGFDIF
jgi:hypothetical protein